MKTKKDLEERIKELESIVELLKKQVDILQGQIPPRKDLEINPISIAPTHVLPTDEICIDGGQHQYPNIWHSVEPPFCEKCGRQAPNYKPTWTTSYKYDPTNVNGLMYSENNQTT